MTVTYRRANPEDLAFIQGVAQHALVRQNNPDAKLFSRWLKRYMVGDNRHDGLCHTHYLITRDNLSVGHIAEYLYVDQVAVTRDLSGKVCYLGFDVHPNYWGQGIMKAALYRYMKDGFESNRFEHLVSECLNDNSKCKRLLEGVGFLALDVGFADQFWHMWKSKGLGLKSRYWYSYEKWSSDATHQPAGKAR